MTDRIEHVGSAPAAALANILAQGALTFDITDGTGWPTGGAGGDFYVTVSRGQADEERILCSSRNGQTITVANRGVDQTTDTIHTGGSTVEHTLAAEEIDALNLAVIALETAVSPADYLHLRFIGGQVFPDQNDTAVVAATRVFDVGALDFDGTHFIAGSAGVYLFRAHLAWQDGSPSGVFACRYAWMVNGGVWEQGGFVGFRQSGFGGTTDLVFTIVLNIGDRVHLTLNPRNGTLQTRIEEWAQSLTGIMLRKL